MDTSIKVGFGRADVTPEGSVPLGGYGNARSRLSTSVRDRLMATCLAFTDSENNTALVFSTDALHTIKDLVEQARDILCPEFGLERHQILVASTHSHATPDLTLTDLPVIVDARKKYVDGLCEAARKAMADRLPAIVYAGAVQTCGMNFIRHYKLADGTYCGANFGNASVGIIKHASTNDPWVQLIKFARQGGKDITLVNFQAHPCFTSGMTATTISADYIGDLRRNVEEQTQTRCIFFQGAAGNHNGISYLPSETRYNDSAEYGKELANYVIKGITCLRQIKAGQVCAQKHTLNLKLDHSDDWMLPQCMPIKEEWEKNFDRAVSNAQAKALGLNSIYAVNALINRSTLPEAEQMDIYALRVGDLGFAFAPYEMFGANGEFIKDFSPFPMTVVASCANGAHSYLASELAFTHGCYEVDNRRYPKGTAELLADNFVEMLKKLKN